MTDAVADVLAERSHVGSSPLPGYVISLIAHFLAIGSAVSLVQSRPQPKERVLNVRLAPVRAAMPAPVPKSVAPVIPPLRSETATAPQPVTKPASRPAAPAKSSVFGKDKRAPVPQPAAPPPTPASLEPARGAFPAPAMGAAGVTGLEGGNFPYEMYLERMVSLVGKRWFRPQISREMTTQIYFVIERDGRVHDAAIRIPSGNGTFDRAALRAVMESSPLPPLPFGYEGTYLGVHLTFH